MCTALKKWIMKSLSLLALTTLFAPVAGAFTLIEFTPIQLEMTEYSAQTSDQKNFTVKYCLNAPANVTAGIYKAVDSDSSQKITQFSNEELKAAGCYTYNWASTYDSYNEVGGTPGSAVESGQYFYAIQASGIDTVSLGNQYASDWITVESGFGGDKLKFIDLEVENKAFDPWNDQEVEFTFAINKSANITLKIYDDEDKLIETIVDQKQYETGQYTLDWDGKDMYNENVNQGDYYYELKAEKDGQKASEAGYIKVKKGAEIDDTTVDPRLKDVYVTKPNFDPGKKEKTQIVFTATAKADVTVIIYDSGNNVVEELMDSNDLNPGTYTAEWDGSEAYGVEATYTYKVIAENSKGDDIASGTIEIEEDDKDKKKPNVSKDKVDAIPFRPQFETLYFTFNMDRDADVTIEIREYDDEIATVIKNSERNEGPQSIGWDGRDEYGEYLENGIYEYKIIAENYSGKDVEKGFFSIEDTGSAKHPFKNCGGFTDVDEASQYCEAIQWAKSEGIFQGYPDGSFKANQYINRVEALKVILKALGVNILSSTAENLGFPDVDRFAWYMPFLKTAMSLGIVQGYPDGMFRPNNQVLRVEALVMMLNTAKAKNNIVIPSQQYGQPYLDVINSQSTKWYISYAWFAKSYNLTSNSNYLYPDTPMTRGEMADMLYRLEQSGLLE